MEMLAQMLHCKDSLYIILGIEIVNSKFQYQKG